MVLGFWFWVVIEHTSIDAGPSLWLSDSSHTAQQASWRLCWARDIPIYFVAPTSSSYGLSSWMGRPRVSLLWNRLGLLALRSSIKSCRDRMVANCAAWYHLQYLHGDSAHLTCRITYPMSARHIGKSDLTDDISFVCMAHWRI